MEDKFSTLSVLILEDHSFQRMVAEQTVSGLGIRHLTTAKDAEQALEQLKASGAVDIVICDLDMPGMDGIQFIRHLGEQKLAHSLIVLSALDASLIRIVGDMAQAHGLKVLGNLPKPLSRDRIRELMELHFGEKPEEGRAIVTNELIFDEEDLKQAINDQQFILYYQPKVLLQSGRLVSFEALARWLHPEAGLISPTRFIPLMESTGLITTMTLNLIDIALEQIHKWRSHGRNLSVGINLSSLMLCDTHLPDQLIAKTRALDIPPELLTLEITESSLIQNAARALETLARFRLHGFSLSIDDFGTGYSSMQQLNRIPFSELKIDRSFVLNACNDRTHRAIIEANIGLAHNLGMQAVAEGIETTDDWALLNQLHCDMAQGYFIAKPMPAEQLETWEAEWITRQPISIPKPRI